MALINDQFKNEVAAFLQSGLTGLFQKYGKEHTITADECLTQLLQPPQFELGQAAFPCFPFAKILKIPPQKIAIELQDEFLQFSPHFILRIQPVQGYLNFFCDFAQLFLSFERSVSSEEYFRSPFYNSEQLEKIVVEYSQPNTHKAMHVGHLRCLVLGDAVSNLIAAVGHDVVRVTYPGDVGAHVAKLLWYLCHPPKTLPQTDHMTWLGEMYSLADQEFKKYAGTSQEQDIKNEFSKILSQISHKKGEYYDLWSQTREWSLEYLKDVYQWLDTKFDTWYFESECDEPSKKFVLKKYQEGLFVKSDGAIGIDLSEQNLGFALLLKTDGHGLYLTKDLELLDLKLQDPKVKRSIYVVDARQKFHFDQLFQIAKHMGYPQDIHCYHLSYETVNTTDGAPFSSRSRNGLALLELKSKMEEVIKDQFLHRYQGVWSEAHIQETAQKVGIGALRYGMLRSDNNTPITFSLSEWLRLDGETGPYLQYVYARCSSILQKFSENMESEQTAQVHLEQREWVSEEQELLFALCQYRDVVVQAAEQYRPSLICTYLFQLAKKFNRFYEKCSIKESQGNDQVLRLKLVKMTQIVLGNGLKLIGIPTIDRM